MCVRGGGMERPQGEHLQEEVVGLLVCWAARIWIGEEVLDSEEDLLDRQ